MVRFGKAESEKIVPKREAAYGFLFNINDEIAVVQTSRGYFLPGGGIEADESHVACLIREFQEELGYVIEVNDYLSSGTLIGYAPGKSKCLEMVGHNYLVADTGRRTTKVEMDHMLVWLSLQDARTKLRLTHQAWAIEDLLKNRKVETLCVFNSHWSTWYEALEDVFNNALGDELVVIEHVGSTAIQGMIAKPIIDVDLVMESYESFESIKQKLENLGYVHVGNQGIFEREVFKRRPLTMQKMQTKQTTLDQDVELLDAIPHHLYVCPRGSLELMRHIRFRDALRSNDQLVSEYNAIKSAIINKVGPYDRERYIDLKMTEYQDFFKQSGIVDLHIHTTASDGTLTPEALMTEILLKRLTLFSVTDHDSIENIDAMAKLAKDNRVDYIPGVEISVSFEGKELHILTYGVSSKDDALEAILKRNQTIREVHNKALVTFACERHGCTFDFDQYAHEATRGGWKALNYLLDKGIVTSITDFFSQIEAYGTPLEFEPYDEVIPKLHALGYLLVLAHPPAYYGGRHLSIEMLDTLVSLGIGGIECYSPYYKSQEDAAYYLDYCRERSLAITCGSDYHGAFIPSRMLALPAKMAMDVSYERLKKHIQK
jgi:hypothetical protein